MKRVWMTVAALCLVGGCDKSKENATPIPVAVDKAATEASGKAGQAGGAAENAGKSAVPGKEALAKAGALHPDKPGGAGHPTALPPGHPRVLPQGHPPVGGAPAAPAKKKGFVGTKIEGQVTAATGENAFTVAKIHSDRKALNGKTVRVRGKVVKFNAAIMNRNWLHIQDGSGTVAAGDHDLTVTTDETAKVGDEVTIEGKLATDKDFGAGYAYGAIVESAKISK